MKTRARVVNKYRDFKSGKAVVVIEMDSPSSLQELETIGDEISLEAKKWHSKRTLDQNAYLWCLINELASVVRISPTDIYKKSVKDIGGNCSLVCVRKQAYSQLKAAWESKGIGWVVEPIESKLEGCINAMLYYGSSVYDTEQMGRLIDSVEAELREQGIIPTEKRYG